MAQAQQPSRRATIRMPRYDYRLPGAYFVTICTQSRRHLFGEVRDNVMHSNEIGTMVMETWNSLLDVYPGVGLGSVVVMPDHLHGVVLLGTEPSMAIGPSLGDVMKRFKGRTTNHYLGVYQDRGWPPLDRRLWQRKYHDRIIRTDDELDNIRMYIETNPERWWNRRTEM